jgi:alcohol dehydrogenase class IV
VATFTSPVSILIGEETLKEVTQQIHSLGGSKVMIYADPGIVKAGLLKQVEELLSKSHIPYVIFSDFVPEPPLDVANRAVDALKESGADLVIGMGGGSSLDIAKMAAVLRNHTGTVEDYLNLTGTKKITKKGLPKILIPTTSGTGSEVTDIAVFSLKSTKDVITHPYLLADVAIVDPELTYTLPPRITAATGVDALTHAVEAYISVNASPLTDTLALDAVKRISENLRTAVWHGSNKVARKELSLGSTIAGLSFYNAGVSGVHALAYPLGGLFHIPHGESNAVLLPYVFNYIWPSCMEKMARLASILGVKTEGLSHREAAIEGVRALSHIVKDVGIPNSIKDFGIKEEDIERLAQEAIKQKRLLSRSPKPYSIEDIRQIYHNAYFGILELD